MQSRASRRSSSRSPRRTVQEGSGKPSSRPRWRQGALPEARGAAPEDCPHKPEDTQEPEENQREGSKQLEGAVREAIQREDKGGATQPEREDTQQEPQTEREDKDTQEKPEDPEEAPETEPEDSAELRAWQSSARRASASLQSRWELDSQP